MRVEAGASIVRAGTGSSSVMAEIALSLHRASRAGEFAKTDPTREEVIGRPPVSMRAFVAAQLCA
jgi:NAD(P)H dehydrogenase (quinone)